MQERGASANDLPIDARVPSELLIVAGEASGDLHAARMLSELRQLQPEMRFFGLGGRELRGAGMDIIAESSEISVVGITEAVRILPRARQIFHHLLDEVDRRNTVGAVLVDFPEFNLRLAKALKSRGLKVVYYISPQVWAWRRGRVKTISKVVDTMLVVLPFEVDFYRQYGIEVYHVGHPLVEEMPVLPQVWDQEISPPKTYRISLLPGSRRSEVQANLPSMLEACAILGEDLPIEVSVICAASVEVHEIDRVIGDRSIRVKIVHEKRFDVIAEAHVAICASGTATLEVGLLTTPMVVVYRVHFWTYALGRLLVRLPFISLVNLVLERPAVPELLQSQATGSEIARHVSNLLCQQDRIEAMRDDLSQLRGRLGETGASRRAARQALTALDLPGTKESVDESAEAATDA